MTNTDLAQSTRPLVDYLKTQLPITDDQHAEILAAQLIRGLPHLFAEKPEIFSYSLSMSGSKWNNARDAKQTRG
ncbi:MAG: hypothetical protein V7L22_03710 [Nostoc sp.]|uniref:hypothetical protein n=1 Tax=Nostoc sp. TaxID=1180 RepID=UPI002FF6ECCF